MAVIRICTMTFSAFTDICLPLFLPSYFTSTHYTRLSAIFKYSTSPCLWRLTAYGSQTSIKLGSASHGDRRVPLTLELQEWTTLLEALS